MNGLYELRCVKCRKVSDERRHYTNCSSCSSPLEVVMNYKIIEEKINHNAFRQVHISSLKYVDFYPINNHNKIISLGEGGTPLYHCKNLGKMLGMKNLFMKYEGANPTGAFKDRGTMVEITKAIELGKKTVIVASSGNMAASVSAYSAKAGLPTYVIVPQGTPVGKMSQTLAYGARVIQIRSDYDSAASITKEISKRHGFYLAGDYAFRLEGQKSEAYEIAEQLGWKSPDRVFVPVGCGTNSSAIWKGFGEYKRMGFIDSLPRMVCVQASGASPVVDAFKKKCRKVMPFNKPSTIASAICVGDPLDGIKVMKSIRESKGHALSVDDNKILEAEKTIAKTESIFVEPSSASTLAALKDMLKDGSVGRDETIVLVLTGSGLKDPVSVLKVMYSPPDVEPDIREVEMHLNYGFYDVIASNNNKFKVLFKKIPSKISLRKVILKEFNTEIRGKDIDACIALIGEFMEKGKNIMKGDMQYILEKSIRSAGTPIGRKPLHIKDFRIESVAHGVSKGIVEVEYLGKNMISEATGVGPVDCILKAVEKCVERNGFRVVLKDYQVSVLEGGTSASVSVKATLMDSYKNTIISMGTSPDIIVASVEAFEEGYNILWRKSHSKK